MEKRSFMQTKYIKRILLWLKKRSKLIAASVSLVFVCVVLIIVVVETYHEYVVTPRPEFEEVTTIPETESGDKLRDETNYCFLESRSGCTVQCDNIEDVKISSAFNNVNLSECSGQEIKLILEEVYFTNTTITKGWLNDFPRDIEDLTISSTLLTEIAESAFSGKPFEFLQTLVIANSRIRYLRKHSFKDTKIQTFEFRCIKQGNLFVEFNALEYMADYLNTLQFNGCIDDVIAIKNITGTGETIFNKLSAIDLSYNTFTNVANFSFVDTPRLVSLYLFSNNINAIDVKAFDQIGSSLQLLYVNNNKLRTLPEGVFDGFTRGGQIDIDGNPWECNCDLLWLKHFYIKNIHIYFQNGSIPFSCTAGNYSDVDFCPGSTTTIDTSITTSTITTVTTQSTHTIIPDTVPTTENPNNFVLVDCKDITNFPDTSLEELNRIYSHTVRIRNGTIIYNFYQIQGTPNFEIIVLNNVGNDYLIWINSKNSSDYGCVTNVQDTVILNNLQYGKTYTICLLAESAETVTPFDCTSLLVPLEWKNSAWILNKHIPAVIGGLVGITIAIILITSTIMFYTIRQNPKLIKGNKRVLIVRNKSADALVMPNYEKQQYVPQSIYTNSEGYLTPRNKMYEKINERRTRPLNSITDKFYRDFHGTTSGQSRSSYAGFLHRKSVGSEVYEPPPLPPNHPSEKPGSSRQCSVYKH